MTFRFRPMSQADAEAIAGWHYPEPFSFYDWAADPNDLAELLDPTARGDGYFAVEDEGGSLIGFFHQDAARPQAGDRARAASGADGTGSREELRRGRARLRPRALRPESVLALRRQLQSARNQRVRARRLLRGPRLLALDEWRRVGVRRNGTTRLEPRTMPHGKEGVDGSSPSRTLHGAHTHEVLRSIENPNDVIVTRTFESSEAALLRRRGPATAYEADRASTRGSVPGGTAPCPPRAISPRRLRPPRTPAPLALARRHLPEAHSLASCDALR
jgi:hypothetical protein